MRKKIVAGNWKMNTTLPDGFNLAKDVIAKAAEVSPDVVLIAIPPFTHLSDIVKVSKGTRLRVGAQNCAVWEKGAYTGEVSAPMLQSVGVEYVILGHSERREYFGEDNLMLFKKIELALANNLVPIFCCGEKLDERESNNHFRVIEQQVTESLFGLSTDQMLKVVIAYEPVWAIGTGKTATADQAQEIHAFIRGVIAKKFGNDLSRQISILYGGSCKPSNAAEIFAKPDVDGGLIGGASLVAADFIGIAKSF
ncbi:MAG: triose-phosphate isomerase [Bacteroidales bacterium]